MIFDCGYRIDLDENGVLTYFDEPSDTQSSSQVSISLAEVQEIRDVLNQYHFFTSEYDWGNDEGSLSYGSATITYESSESSQSLIKTIPFEGEHIPEPLARLRIELENVLKSNFDLD